MHHGLLPVESQSPREALRLYAYQELKGGYQTFSKHACGKKSILAPLQHFMFGLGCLFSATLLMRKNVPIRLAFAIVYKQGAYILAVLLHTGVCCWICSGSGRGTARGAAGRFYQYRT